MNLTVVHKYVYNNKIYTNKYTALGIEDARNIMLQCYEQDHQEGYKCFSRQVFTESNEFVSVMA